MNEYNDEAVQLFDARRHRTSSSSSSIFTALHGMQTRSRDEDSVCPSVRLSARLSVRPFVKRVLCDKMEEIPVEIFTSYERSFSLVF